jgi:hypothetical protein
MGAGGDVQVSQTDLPQALPAPAGAAAEMPLPALPIPVAGPAPDFRSLQDFGSLDIRRHPSFLVHVGRFFLALGGWLWRWLVGAAMCFNFFVVSWITSIVAVGWTNRVVQMMVLRCWWWRSELREGMTFAEFCDSLGEGAPVHRPRWFVQERLLARLDKPRPGGGKPDVVTVFGRMLFWPWHSLWLNFKLGFKATFCTYALLGLPCLLMLWSWEQGWLNSFHGGYEQAWLGPTIGFLGVALFIAAMFYVPMAQAHQAATGQARAFFDFRFVWQLVRTRITAYVMLAAFVGFWAWIQLIARNTVVSASFSGNAAASAEAGLQHFRVYLFQVSLLLFPVWVLLRVFGGLVYQSAVLKALRTGTVVHADLHPVLRDWLTALNLRVLPRAAPTGLTWAARLTARWTYRRVMFTVLFFVWLAFFVRFYLGYFFVYDPYVGFLNHPMIQVPCFDFVPYHLYQGLDF